MDILLMNLTQTYGPTANEKKVSDMVESELVEFFDEVKSDALGNLIGCKKGTGRDSKSIMLVSPMDQKCLIVTHVEKKGKYRFSVLGDWDLSRIVNAKVVFENGIEGNVLLEEGIAEPAKVSDLYIETRVLDEEEKDAIRLGNSAVFQGEYIEGEDKLIAPALNPRLGCKILIDVVKSLNTKLNCDLYVVFSAHGMVEARGALTATYGINPDIGLSIGGISEENGPQMGEGPVILMRDAASISHPDLVKEFEEVAQRAGIKVQRAVSVLWISNAAGIVNAGCDTSIISLGFTVRDMTTTKEQGSKLDMENLKKLIYLWLKEKAA